MFSEVRRDQISIWMPLGVPVDTPSDTMTCSWLQKPSMMVTLNHDGVTMSSMSENELPVKDRAAAPARAAPAGMEEDAREGLSMRTPVIPTGVSCGRERNMRALSGRSLTVSDTPPRAIDSGRQR
jgi:hypothetical protein